MTRIVSFYTPNYRTEGVRLKRSLERLGIPTDGVMEVRDLGDWYAATAFKSTFLESQSWYHDEPLLWIDADAFVHEDPRPYFDDLDGMGYDFAAHWFQGPAGGYDRHRNDNRMLAGTLWFGTTLEADVLLEMWEHLNRTLQRAAHCKGGGQKNLWLLVRGLMETGRLKVERIPGRYCRVFDKPWAYGKDEPVIIEHLIASRENRDKSAGTVDVARQQRIAELDDLLRED